MKLVCVIILIVLSSFLHQLTAQNWSLVVMGKTYHYSCDTTNTIFSIWADSMHVNGQDTTYYLNRLILPCDTCISLQNIFGTDASFMIRNRPLFLRREVNILQNGRSTLISPDTLVFDKGIIVGNNWIFDSFPSITASVYFKGIGTVLGVSDSLMGIKLNSIDTIIISKDHGVVKWPCISGSYFRLIGVEGEDTIGYHVPDSTEIYDFHVGDRFYYEDRQLWPDRDYLNQICVKIDSVFYTGMTKKYSYQYYQMGHLNDYGWNIHTWWGNGDTSNCDILIQESVGINNDFSLNKMPIEHCRSFQDKRICSDILSIIYYSIFKIYLENNISVFEQLPRKYFSLVDYYGFPFSYKDILVNNDILETHHILIKEKKGLVENIEGYWEGGWGRTVSVQILNGDTLTTPNSLCIYLNIEKKNSKFDINIFPNPSSGLINIFGITSGRIEIYSMIGERMYFEDIENKLIDEPKTINLSKGIKPGMYIVKINSEKKQFTYKLILQ